MAMLGNRFYQHLRLRTSHHGVEWCYVYTIVQGGASLTVWQFKYGKWCVDKPTAHTFPLENARRTWRDCARWYEILATGRGSGPVEALE